ncbi:hypothetical protein Dimus_013716, partial [Dionaea muscipula]
RDLDGGGVRLLGGGDCAAARSQRGADDGGDVTVRWWMVMDREEILNIVPMAVGGLCSVLFIAFPTKRHGIGYPVTAATASTGKVATD